MWRGGETMTMTHSNETLTRIGARASAGAIDISQRAGVLWYIAADGLKRCTKCGRKIETLVRWPGYEELQKVNCVCDCGAKYCGRVRKAIQEETEKMEKAERYADTFGGSELARSLRRLTFERDDSPAREGNHRARQYAEKFPDVKKWLYFYGPSGAGKTFSAVCIANAVLDKGHTVRVMTPQQLEAQTWDDRDEMFRELLKYDLFILDDLGTERRSDYSYELIYRLIDDRDKAGKPMVITSNIPALELANVTDTKAQRIARRITDNAVPFEFKMRGREK